jgi:hypothetical protein
MGFEKWIAAVGLALFLMFVGEMISVYTFMTNVPEDFNFGLEFDPNPKIYQFISIGVAPASIMVGLPYLMIRSNGSKPIGYLIIAGGAVMLIGMAYCFTLVDKIEDFLLTEVVTFTPVLFMILSIPVMVLGASLLKIKKKRPKKEFF